MNSPRVNAEEQVERWDETLRCPSCKLTGTVSLSQGEGDLKLTILSMPAGFKVVGTDYGPSFYCEACDVRVEP